MAVLTPARRPHGAGGLPPAWTGFGGGGGDDSGDGRGRFPPRLPQLGILLGLVSIGSFFGALAVLYAVVLPRTGAAWRHVHPPGVLWASTALILSSSLALERTRYALRRGLVDRASRRFATTLVLGVAFLTSQLLAWADLVRQGFLMGPNPHASMFYVFTGAHGLHVLGGIAWLAYLLHQSLRPGEGEQPLRRLRRGSGAFALYWHFLGCLWVFLFVLLLVWS